MDPLPLDRAMEAARPAPVQRDAVLGAVRAALFASDAAPGEPARIDRYVIERRLGHGGMGVVWAARDLRLDRHVAIKLLHHEGLATDRGRMMREAQALARLSHPNVVEVFDVGLHAGQVFIAMALVDGVTLAQWLTTPRPWRSVLSVFLAAGRGLQAAHAAGLVHRDFKPANVMIEGAEGTSVGRVRVMDFGLALRAESAQTDPRDAPAAVGTTGRWLDASLTQTGQRVGTPAYMAPEQHAGATIDAAADQFAFCASLWEALTGARPFAGDTLQALVDAKHRGAIRPPPPGLGVPRRVLEVVRRGMSPRPSARHADIEALLVALSRATRGPSRALGGVAVVGVAAWAIASSQAAGERGCDVPLPDAMREWPGELRGRVAHAFDPAGGRFVTQTRDQALGLLDARVASWLERRDDACDRFAANDPARASAAACLDTAAGELVAVARALVPERDAVLDATVLPHVVPAIAALPDVARCVAPGRGYAAPARPDDGARAEAVAAVRAQLEVSHAQRSTGHLAEARAALAEAERQASGIEYAPLTAELALARGHLELDEAAHAEAEESLRAAYFTAIESGGTQVAAEAATTLVFVLGSYLARADDALQWSRHAEAAVAELGDPVAQAELDTHVGVALAAMGRRQEARDRFGRAIAALREGTDIGTAMQYLGVSYTETGELTLARDLFEQVIARRERLLGVDHPFVAVTRVNLANALLLAGDLQAALREHERALAIQVAALGEEHPEVAVERNNLGSLLDSMGDLPAARQQHALAHAAFEASLGRDHPYTAATLVNLGRVDVRLGDLDRAEAELERGRAILEQVLPPDHPHVDVARLGLAEVELARGQPSRALATVGAARRGCGDAERTLCGELGFVRAKALRAEGRTAESEAALADALAVLGQTAPDDELRRRIAAWRDAPVAG